METLGFVPPAIRRMFEMDKGLGSAYTDHRQIIFAERDDGLPLKFKELLLVAMDLSADNLNGAMGHLKAAKAAGLTQAELKEALLIAWLVLGISSWGKVGQHLWTAMVTGEFPHER
jgi:alkylhydroperoxidase/carboxymuconolactone decarboxylase family protein YurZ